MIKFSKPTFFFVDKLGFLGTQLAIGMSSTRHIILGSIKSIKSKELVAFRAKLLPILHKGFDSMLLGMFKRRSNFKVFNPIVAFNSINMVNNLKWKWLKLTAKMLLHYQSMLVVMLSIYTYFFITMLHIATPIRGFFESINVSMSMQPRVMLGAITFGIVLVFAIRSRACFHNDSTVSYSLVVSRRFD
jgi:hypothetical protein